MKIYPSNKNTLEKYFPERPHPLPSTLKYFIFLNEGTPIGYIGLGYGISQRELLTTLFDYPLKIADYWEICRSYTKPEFKNAPSAMLGAILRMLKKYSNKKFIYTTGAGFQGLTGRIYQAANFKYIGYLNADIWYIKGLGYIHTRSMRHRYIHADRVFIKKIYPTIVKRFAPIFRYIYFLKNENELMVHAKFKILSYPKREDIKVIEDDLNGNKKEIHYLDAYDRIASLKVKTLCRDSLNSKTSAIHAGDGVHNHLTAQ